MDPFIIVYPFDEVLVCEDCYGVPGNKTGGPYKLYGDLTKHLKRHHPGRGWKFRCRHCGLDFPQNGLKKLKSHEKQVHSAAASPPTRTCRRRRTAAASPPSSSEGENEDQPQDQPRPRARAPRRAASRRAMDHIAELQRTVREVSELRVNLTRELDISRSALDNPTAAAIATSTPVPAQPPTTCHLAGPAEIAEDEALLDRLAGAGDEATWNSILQESLRARRGRRPRRPPEPACATPPARPLSITSSPAPSASTGRSSSAPVFASTSRSSPPVSAPTSRPPTPRAPARPSSPTPVAPASAHSAQPAPLGPGPSPPGSPPGPFDGEPDDDDYDDLEPIPTELSAWQRQWLQRFPADLEWNAFLTTLGDLTASLAPEGRPGQAGQRRPQLNQNQGRPAARRNSNAEAAKLQRLYRSGPRRAMREILQEASPSCTIPEPQLTDHFMTCHAPRQGCSGDPPLNCQLPRAPAPPLLLDHVRPEEVARLLKKTSNTAPGPDGVKYAVWRRRDPSGHVLAAVFNICLAARRFPPAWKQSTTVLIHKKGDTAEVTNWRPIALSNTAGKLLCSLLADRLTTWTSTHHLISDAQKGFTQAEGCLEHNFVLQELLDDARRRGTEVCVAWLDLANAFGSVPHPSLVAALRSAGLTGEQIALIEDLYEGSATTIRHAGGATPPIPFGAGVRQGCPLSPILFNLVMEFLIRPLVALGGQHGATLHAANVSVLAYADDLALVAKSEASMQALLDAVVPAAEWVGLKFKPAKCASLHVARRATRPTSFSIYGQPLQVLREGDFYQHLGVPTGVKADQTPVAAITRLERDVRRIFGSLLAPWQKLHAIRTFIVPQLDFSLRTARIRKTALRELDKAIRSGCKRVLNLPSRASAELVYLPPSSGGAGLLPLADVADLAAVSHAFRLLTSPDPTISRLALEGVAMSAGHRSAEVAGMELLSSYLNGDIAGNPSVSRQVASTFSAARAARIRLSKRLPDLRWNFCIARGSFELHVPGPGGIAVVDGGARHALSSRLRSSMQHHYRATLAAKPDQGRVARVTTTCTTANHMLHEGRYTRFADWRFVHRARLNVLPLNGCRRWGAGDRRCRRCGRHDETTAHVLCHCSPQLSNGITKRHNAVLDTVTAAVRPRQGLEIRVDKTVPLEELTGRGRGELPEDITTCRPDMVVIDRQQKIINIVDAAIPYEDGWQSIEAARERKLLKYEPLAGSLRTAGYQVTVDALIVGALGAWDSANWVTLAHLGIARRFGNTLARRCVSTAIRWSRDLYVTHITGVQQWP